MPKEITAICNTAKCTFKKIPSVFISETEATQCGACGEMMTVTTREVIDGKPETE
jgi:hypothetical protein